MTRVCLHSDAQCIYGEDCPFTCATDAYDGTKRVTGTEDFLRNCGAPEDSIKRILAARNLPETFESLVDEPWRQSFPAHEDDLLLKILDGCVTWYWAAILPTGEEGEYCCSTMPFRAATEIRKLREEVARLKALVRYSDANLR
jgi:hypothetical protein